MHITYFITALLLIFGLARLSIGDESAQDPTPAGRTAVSFKAIGRNLAGNKYVFVTDCSGNARMASLQITKSWVRVKNTPADIHLYILWNAGKFGNVVVEADNNGHGYNACDNDYFLLNIELARTQARKLASSYKKAADGGYTLPAGLKAEIETSLTLFDKTKGVDNENKIAKLADVALESILFAHEKLVLECAQQDIEKYRKSDAQITVIDSEGKPLPDVKIEIHQLTRDFLIGHNAMAKYEQYQDKFLGTTNFATLPFYLSGLAPEYNHYKWDKLETDAKWLIAHEIKPKGHPLTWFFDQTNPDYFKNMDWEETVKFCEENTRKNVKHFAGLIDMWDVINEAHGWANGKFTQDQMDELTDIVTRAAKDTNPDASIVVNSCLPLGQYVQWDQSERSTPYEYYDRLNKMKVPYDIIGLQMYNGIASPFPTCDITMMSEILDRFSKLGKPINITEFSVPSDADQWGTWHSEKWAEQTQAEYVKAFYTMAFSKPYIDAITWWCLWDGANWVKTTGVLREDLSEKPAYHILRELVDSWTTNQSGRTDLFGKYVFRGFQGSYTAKIVINGKEHVTGFHIGKERAQVTVKI